MQAQGTFSYNRFYPMTLVVHCQPILQHSISPRAWLGAV